MRQWMTEKREKMGLTTEGMAQLCQCSEKLLGMLEYGADITCPGIASRIAYRYGLTLEQYNDLVHESKRAKKLPSPEPPPKERKGYECFCLPGSIYKF